MSVPTINSVDYNGEEQSATVADSDYYNITKNDKHKNAGSYDVVLTLSSGAENYRDGMHADVYNDKLVYVKSDYGYQLMAYEFDDTLVEISCKYNFDTLKAIDDSLRFDL